MLNKKILTVLGAATFALTTSACSGAETSVPTQAPTQASVEKAASSATGHAAMMISGGTFEGRSDHITTGKVTVEKTATGYQLRFADNFSLDGAPDPVVALGNGETFSVSNKLGALKQITGGQTYALPASFKPGQFSEVYVWCEKFSVPLGVAKLSAG